MTLTPASPDPSQALIRTAGTTDRPRGRSQQPANHSLTGFIHFSVATESIIFFASSPAYAGLKLLLAQLAPPWRGGLGVAHALALPRRLLSVQRGTIALGRWFLIAATFWGFRCLLVCWSMAMGTVFLYGQAVGEVGLGLSFWHHQAASSALASTLSRVPRPAMWASGVLLDGR